MVWTKNYIVTPWLAHFEPWISAILLEECTCWMWPWNHNYNTTIHNELVAVSSTLNTRRSSIEHWFLRDGPYFGRTHFDFSLNQQRRLLSTEKNKLWLRYFRVVQETHGKNDAVSTMRHVRLFSPRPPKKTFEILLLLLASASVFFLVYVHYHMPPKVWKIKAENELYVVPGELLASGHVQRFNPKVVYEDFTKEHRGSLTKQDHGLLDNIMHKTTTTTLRVEGAFDLGSPEEETYLLHTTSAFSTIPGSYTRPGFLNHHVWEHICNFRVESLRESILFPNAPSRRSFLASFQTNGTSKNFGDRIFGYIHPDISGQYKFAVSSDDNSELWLSSDKRSENLRKISNVGSWNESSPTMPGEYTKFPSQVSVNVNLTKGRKYFIELLHKQKSGMSHLEVAWQTPEESEFKIITSEYVSAFVDDRHVADNAVSVQDYTETPSQSRDSMPTVDRTELGAVLPSCPYEPSYLVRHKLVRFQVG